MRLLYLLMLSSLLFCAGCNPVKESRAQAFADAKAKAEAGDPAAERELGQMYIWGKGVWADEDQGVKWLQKAAADGDPQALGDLTDDYLSGFANPSDPAKAHAMRLQLAQHGVVQAEGAVGYDFAVGRGTPIDYSQALGWLRKAATGNNVAAIENLANMYAHGLGVGKDEAAVISLYKQAAALGNRHAQLFLASLYDVGLDAPVDEAASQGYFAQAAGADVQSLPELSEAMIEIIEAHTHTRDVYPDAALKAGQYGLVRVGFDCKDRRATDIKIIKSSGFPAIDAAAQLAVADSLFPGHASAVKWVHRFEIDVDFAPGTLAAPAPAATTP